MWRACPEAKLREENNYPSEKIERAWKSEREREREGARVWSSAYLIMFVHTSHWRRLTFGSGRATPRFLKILRSKQWILWTRVLLHRSVVHDGWNLWQASVNISWNTSFAKYCHCRASPTKPIQALYWSTSHSTAVHRHAKATESAFCLEDSTALFIYFVAPGASSEGMRELQTINLVRRNASQPARMTAWHTSISTMAPANSWRFAQDNLSQ